MPTLFPTAQVLRILLNHTKELPAILDAISAIRQVDGLYEGWDAVKHFGDLLIPIAVDIQDALGDRVLGDGTEVLFTAAECDVQACADAGVDWDRIIAALPQVIAVVKMLLLLLAKKE